MSSPPILATAADAFPGFKPKVKIATIFLEHDKHLLLLKRCDQEEEPNRWNTPGGKVEEKEEPLQAVLRELREETRIAIAPEEVVYHGHRYIRIPDWDYIIHIYQAEMIERAAVQLDTKKHSEYKWIPLSRFKSMPLLKGGAEVFDVVYGSKDNAFTTSMDFIKKPCKFD